LEREREERERGAEGRLERKRAQRMGGGGMLLSWSYRKFGSFHKKKKIPDAPKDITTA
jgi:hypothetical protein